MINRRELLESAGFVPLLPLLSALDAPASPGRPQPHATLQLGPSHRGAGNHRWALILGGTVTGNRLAGRVRSGRMDWHVDPASGAAEASVRCEVLCSDGRIREMRERGVHPAAAGSAVVRFRACNFT
jgi:Protein of unknown function (DUF3237)